jgi:predicted Zn-dependent protease
MQSEQPENPFINFGDPESDLATSKALARLAEEMIRRIEQDEDTSPEELASVAESRRFFRENEKLDRRLEKELRDDPVGLHASYAVALFENGHEVAALEAVNRVRKLRPTEMWVFTMLGETLLEHGHYAEAAKWYTVGLVRRCGALADIAWDELKADSEATDLVRGRHQARQVLGLAPDHLDELLELHGTGSADSPEPKPRR